MNRRRFVEIFSFLPFVRKIDLDDVGLFDHWNEGVEVEPSIFAHWHEETDNEPQALTGPGLYEFKENAKDYYSAGKWTPFGQLQFKQES